MSKAGSIYSKIVFGSKLLTNKRVLTSLADSKMRNLMLALKSGSFFLYNIGKYPDKLAVIDGERRITYREFSERISRLNGGLLSSGMSTGDRLAIIAVNSAEFLESIFGPILIGIKTVPVNWHLKEDEIEYVVNNSGARALVISEEFIDKIIAIRSKLVNVKKIIVIGDNAPDDMISYEKFLDESSPYQEKSIPGGGLMFYTSGTTGKPKGASSRAIEDITKLSSDDIADLGLMVTNTFYGFKWDKTTNIHLASAPLYHTSPSAHCGITFYFSGTVVIMGKFDSEKALQLIENEKISTTFMPPILLRRIMNFSEKEKYDV
ncbi:MAG: AMP-binding protein, partial [Bacteroidetes bacterium]|nr:AMP-binding protein [Bacteroidota bacterium]